MADAGTIYAACRERRARLVGSLDDGQLVTRVTATDAWTAHDVIAHQAGIVADIRGTLGIEGYCAVRSGQVAAAGVAPVLMRAGDDQWRWGDGTARASVTAEPYVALLAPEALSEPLAT
jgi:hypothetical protein